MLSSSSEIVFDEEEVLNFIVQHPDFEALRVTFYEVEALNTFDAQLLSCEDLTAQLRLKVRERERERKHVRGIPASCRTTPRRKA